MIISLDCMNHIPIATLQMLSILGAQLRLHTNDFELLQCVQALDNTETHHDRSHVMNLRLAFSEVVEMFALYSNLLSGLIGRSYCNPTSKSTHLA